jgi:uncharacterized protein (DUF697 family)
MQLVNIKERQTNLFTRKKMQKMYGQTLSSEKAQQVFDDLIDIVEDSEVAQVAYEVAKYYGQTYHKVVRGSTEFFTFSLSMLRPCSSSDFDKASEVIKSALNETGIKI